MGIQRVIGLKDIHCLFNLCVSQKYGSGIRHVEYLLLQMGDGSKY